MTVTMGVAMVVAIIMVMEAVAITRGEDKGVIRRDFFHREMNLNLTQR